MKHWLEQQVEMRPNHCAIDDGKTQLTFLELYKEAKTLAYHLRGLSRTRMGVYIENTIEAVKLIHAAWLADIEIALLNARLTEREMKNQMTSVDIDTIVYTKPLQLDGFRMVDFDSLHTRPAATTLPDFNIAHIASIMFTSGTTGPQKAVPQTYRNHAASAQSCKQALGYDSTSVWLLVLPLYHISGLSILLRSVMEGFTVNLVHHFETEMILDRLRVSNITHISLVPQTFQWLMDAGLTHPHELQKILLGGAKLSKDLIARALAYHLPIYNSFGMTETCSQFLIATPSMLAERYDTVGKPSSDVAVQIKHPNAEGHGELLIRGENVMQGYLYPEHTTDVFESGYFNTGDIASIDESGYVMIYDRRKDLIISGGENIYPYEIEQCAKLFPDVRDAMCIAQSDETWGQVPCLYYVSENVLDEAALYQHLKHHLAKYKLPKVIKRAREIPYTSTGKLQRNRPVEEV